jgi:transposase
MAGKKGMTHYKMTTKEEAVYLFLEEGVTYREIAKRMNIRDAERIRMWVKQYRKEGVAAFTKPQGRPKKVEDEKAYVARLEMENNLLKKLQSELREVMLAKRDTGQSVTIKKNTR